MQYWWSHIRQIIIIDMTSAWLEGLCHSLWHWLRSVIKATEIQNLGKLYYAMLHSLFFIFTFQKHEISNKNLKSSIEHVCCISNCVRWFSHSTQSLQCPHAEAIFFQHKFSGIEDNLVEGTGSWSVVMKHFVQ